MASSPVINSRNRWAATLAGIVLTVCIGVLFFLPLPFFETLHGKLYDLAFQIRGPVTPPPDVTVVAIDDDSLSRVGRWPWPRSTCAALIDRLSQDGAGVIALDIVFLPDTGQSGTAETQLLKEAIARAGNVVLPFYFEFGKAGSAAGNAERDAACDAQAFLLFDDPKKFADYPPPSASNLFAPSAEIAQSAKALGHINVMADPDGTVRRAPAIIKYRDAYYPSFAIQAFSQAYGLTRGDITVHVGESVRLGKISLPTDTRGMALVNYYGGNGTVRPVSAADVLEGKTKGTFKNRIVFVGITAAGLAAGVQDLMATPFANRFPGVEKHAQEAASMVQGRFLARPAWVSFIEFGLILILGLPLAFLLPACRPAIRLISTLIALIFLSALAMAAFYSGIWLKAFFPLALVVLLFAVSALIRPRSVPAQTAVRKDGTVLLQPSAENIEDGIIPEAPGALSKIGRYEILGELGQGAMGIVYRGRDPIINRPVAIKTIRFDRLYEASEIQDMKARFFKEAQAAGKLIHPSIVTVFDVGDEKGLSFIAMEYVEGKDLSCFNTPDSLLPWRQICAITADAAEALDFAHRQGVVHRDIKPANIMLTPDGQVKVMDFGIAKIASSTMTQMGSIMGTPPYMSPEQIDGPDVDGRSDLFSLGSVLYELLTGTKPFKGENMAALWHQILEASAVPASSINTSLPSRLDDILSCALAKSPQDRYQSGKQMADALREIINNRQS